MSNQALASLVNFTEEILSFLCYMILVAYWLGYTASTSLALNLIPPVKLWHNLNIFSSWCGPSRKLWSIGIYVVSPLKFMRNLLIIKFYHCYNYLILLMGNSISILLCPTLNDVEVPNILMMKSLTLRVQH